MIKSVCVYCASSNQVDESYLQSAFELGKIFAKQNIEIVYGGGGSGLMGKLANGALHEGGKVTGIIPGFMKDVKWDHPDVANMQIVASMHERKRSFIEQSDAIVALPGGPGTFEELLEAITLKQLGQHTHPIVIVNLNNYFNPLIALLQQAIDQKFMAPHHALCWNVVNTIDEVIPAIINAHPWSKDAINTAAMK